MMLPGETEAGSAGMQPCRGIPRRAHRDDAGGRESGPFALLPENNIGSVDPNALKIPARRAESCSRPARSRPQIVLQTRKTKPVPEWTWEDARQVLADSPWSRLTIGAISRLETEDERRSGGNMGQEHGVGYDGVDGHRTAKQTASNFFTASPGAQSPPKQDVRLTVRWESAFPVRAAELKTGFIEPPVSATEGYDLAVYGVPGEYFSGDPVKLGAPLRDAAVLKRHGKPDVKPARVEVFERQDGLVVVYVFPPSVEISSQDGTLEFDAHIGRLGFVQFFDSSEMIFRGKMEL